MKTTMIKKGLDYSELEKLGYNYSISEGGYISKDEATVISISRCPYKRQVMQYIPNAEIEHIRNIEELIKINAIE